MHQELSGFMLLYVETAGRNGVHVYQFLADPNDFDKLWERAKAFVGEHAEVDGCSTKPVLSVVGETHRISRGTSFGPRSAAITRLPILR